MEFSVVELGYDREQVDHCLNDLGEQLERMTAEAAGAAAGAAASGAAAAGAELAVLREEVARLRRIVRRRPAVYRTSVRLHDLLQLAQEEAAEIVAQANEELAAARREAAELRERAYNDAVQARRDFEAALQARRRREKEVDVILRRILISDGPDAPDGGGVREAAVPDQPPARRDPVDAGATPDATVIAAGSRSGSDERDAPVPAGGEGPRPVGARWPRIRNRMISAGR